MNSRDEKKAEAISSQFRSTRKEILGNKKQRTIML